MQDKNTEGEANLFACLLLMPRHFIEQDLKDGLDLCDDTHLNNLAKKYQVPVTALHFRISYFLKHNQ